MISGWLLLVDRMRDVFVAVIIVGAAAAAAAIARTVVCCRVAVVV